MSEAKHAAPPLDKKRTALLNALIDTVCDTLLAGLIEIVRSSLLMGRLRCLFEKLREPRPGVA